MQTQRGFISFGVFIAILVGLAVLGGGAYYVVHQSPPKTPFKGFADLPNIPLVVSPTSGTAPLTVQVTTNFVSPGAYTVDFGDGETLRANLYEQRLEKWSTKIYTSPGTYTIKLLQDATFSSSNVSTPIKQKVLGTQTVTISKGVTQQDLQTFKSENGFQFQYPSIWKATGNEQANTNYQVLARVVNSARAGKPDTDVPIEQFFVRRMDVACQEGSAATFAGKAAYDTGWVAGGLDPSMSYRTVCAQVNGWPIYIIASAYDKASKTIMDTMFASFTFTQ